MANYKRNIRPGAAYFFTVLTHDRRSFLTDDIAREVLRYAFEHVQSNKPFETIALCLLPQSHSLHLADVGG